MNNKTFTKLNDSRLEVISGGDCSWGGLTRSVAKPASSPELRIINGIVYSLTCWW